MIKVLFVCLGNICRSPMAEIVFSDLVSEKGLNDKFFIDSCGTSDYHEGEEADPRTIDTLRAKNHMVDHIARPLIKEDFFKFDYIIAMDQQNIDNIEMMAPENHNAGIFLFRTFEEQPDDVNVPDPYWSGADGFDKVYNMVFKCSHGFLSYLDKNHNLLNN